VSWRPIYKANSDHSELRCVTVKAINTGLRTLQRIPSALITGVIVLLSLAVVFLTLPGRPLILHSLQKLAHPAVFLVIAVSIWLLFSKHLFTAQQRPLWLYGLTFVGAVTLGAATEALQALVHRDPSWHDVFLDAKGALLGLSILLVFDHSWHHRFDREIRAAVALIALAIMAIQLLPACTTLAAYQHREHSFPTLFAPNSDLDLLLVSTQGAPATPHPVDSELATSDSEIALSVPLYVRPGIFSLDEPVARWSDYHVICVELINPGHSGIDLNLRIRDRHVERNAPLEGIPLHLDGRSRLNRCINLDEYPNYSAIDWQAIRQVMLVRTAGVGVEFMVKKIYLSKMDESGSDWQKKSSSL